MRAAASLSSRRFWNSQKRLAAERRANSTSSCRPWTRGGGIDQSASSRCRRHTRLRPPSCDRGLGIAVVAQVMVGLAEVREVASTDRPSDRSRDPRARRQGTSTNHRGWADGAPHASGPRAPDRFQQTVPNLERSSHHEPRLLTSSSARTTSTAWTSASEATASAASTVKPPIITVRRASTRRAGRQLAIPLMIVRSRWRSSRRP